MSADREKAESLQKAAPKLNEKDIDALNEIFRAFLFKGNKIGEYWTSCCRKHVPSHDDWTDAEYEALTTSHTPEPIIYWNKVQNPESETRATCPLCGREVTVKTLGKTGTRKNLYSYARAVVLKWHRGALWALAFSLEKGYCPGYSVNSWVFQQRGYSDLIDAPTINLCGVYKFQPGKVSHAWKYYWVCGNLYNYEEQKAIGKKKPGELGRPFGWSNEWGLGYELINPEAVRQSPFRYVGFEDMVKEHMEPIQLLTASCFYTEKLEHLHKMGLDKVIKRYIHEGIKSAWLIRWKEDDPKKFLTVRPKVLSAMLAEGTKLETIQVWKDLKEREPIETVQRLGELVQQKDRKTVCKFVRTGAFRLGKFLDYIEEQAAKSYLDRRKSHAYACWQAAEQWGDYIRAAENLGLDINNPVILMPKDLHKQHDKRTKAWSAILEERKRKDAEAREAKRYDAVRRKYAFELNGLCIVAPKSTFDIIAEGKALGHCVGGYAGRHANGVLTILFLRRASSPDKSLVTIEMRGNQLQQIHGYKNEREACVDNPDQLPPSEIYKDFLEAWQAWLAAGSKRNKDGSPKLPRIKNKKENAA